MWVLASGTSRSSPVSPEDQFMFTKRMVKTVIIWIAQRSGGGES